MKNLIQDLLAISRVGEKGRIMVPVDLNVALRTALANLETAIKESAAVIDAASLPTLPADSTQMTQVFQNLVGNSLKYRVRDRPPVIHIQSKALDDNWVFSVSDNGMGIEPRHFQRIFGIFQRLHSRNEYPGTGIGLALCKKIVEHHDGMIWVESIVGHGSTFHFTLPIAANGSEPERR